MKHLNWILSVGLLLWALWQMFNIGSWKGEANLYGFLLTMAGGIIFFGFYIVEERNEEIARLRQIILRQQNSNS